MPTLISWPTTVAVPSAQRDLASIYSKAVWNLRTNGRYVLVWGDGGVSYVEDSLKRVLMAGIFYLERRRGRKVNTLPPRATMTDGKVKPFGFTFQFLIDVERLENFIL